MMKQNLLISFEGIDFSGKSTQIDLLCDYFTRQKQSFVVLREPGGTTIGERIRALLLDPALAEMTAETELCLYSAARAQLVREKISPALADGKHVVLDRFYDSTTAYQGYGRQLSLEAIDNLTHVAVGGVHPDLSIYLELSEAAMYRRKVMAGRSDDRLEANSAAFFARVSAGYKKIAKKHKDRFTVIDATQERRVIHDEIVAVIEVKIAGGNIVA
jgi:dTMP kinase